MKHIILPVLLLLSLSACRRKDAVQPAAADTGSPCAVMQQTNPSGGKCLLPNAFTPDGDGRNDVLRLLVDRPDAVTSYELRISDANDNVLYTMTRFHPAWDGINPATGRPYPPGIYNVTSCVIMPAGAGVSIAVDGYSCIALLTKGNRGYIDLRDHQARNLIFESGVDPVTLDVLPGSGEEFCR
jgi:hypothetical protein